MLGLGELLLFYEAFTARARSAEKCILELPDDAQDIALYQRLALAWDDDADRRLAVMREIASREPRDGAEWEAIHLMRWRHHAETGRWIGGGAVIDLAEVRRQRQG
ncbi:hypothetical protein QA634_05810 [Methylobacterium sp. CB376]|uniref:hypothetical protein n=1 Tax=unclassified Methylobacterium TaxID=2615210 RepID=UPI0003007F46|nr:MULTISPECIES: hypothetical protein [Methylobacterium]WFT81405.1 hypothetical protein QA634_05810 [Methylobacterium nodulans]